MQFKGDEFVKNIKLEKEKAKLKMQTDILDAQKKESVIKTPNTNDEPVIIDIKSKYKQNNLNDIRINNSSNNENKKKYFVLAVALMILFVLTIVIIRLISKDKNEDVLFKNSKIEKIKQDNILNTINTNEEYQQAIQKKAKKTIQKKLNLNKIAKKEMPLPNIKEKKEEIIKPKIEKKKIVTDIFEMEKKEIKIKKVIQKMTTKAEVKKVKNVKKSISGSYIQVGAFTNPPSKLLLKSIKVNNLKYVIYTTTIRGIVFNKVLIGPYKNITKKSEIFKRIKKKLNRPDAYILRLK